MNSKTIGTTLLGALAVTVFIFIIEINFYSETNYTTSKLNEILLWSFIRGLVISLAVNIANYYRSRNKEN